MTSDQPLSRGDVEARPAADRARSPAATVTVVAADDRPVVRAGLRAVIAASDDLEVLDVCPLATAVQSVETHLPAVLVVAVRANDPEPFRVVATARALHEQLSVLAVADGASVIDLREAVIAGVDSFLLTTSSADEIRRAIAATATGERVVSSDVAVELAGTWRQEGRGRGAAALTPRELEVLQLLAEGLTNQEIGARLDLSARTIKTHVQHLIGKLDVPDRTGAVARAFRLGLIQ